MRRALGEAEIANPSLNGAVENHPERENLVLGVAADALAFLAGHQPMRNIAFGLEILVGFVGDGNRVAVDELPRLRQDQRIGVRRKVENPAGIGCLQLGGFAGDFNSLLEIGGVIAAIGENWDDHQDARRGADRRLDEHQDQHGVGQQAGKQRGAEQHQKDAGQGERLQRQQGEKGDQRPYELQSQNPPHRLLSNRCRRRRGGVAEID